MQKRQTFLFSATIAMQSYDKQYSKEQIFGKFMEKEDPLIEIGNTEEADKAFQRTVEGLE